MSKYAARLVTGAVALATASLGWGQMAVSAKSGMIHHAEGQVQLNNEPVKLKFGQFPEVGNGMTLATTNGRAEVLLTPGVFLRLDRNASFRMISNSLIDTQIQLVSGTALLEVEELEAAKTVTVRMHDALLRPGKLGLFRLDAGTGVVRVYDGSLKITEGGQSVVAKKGNEVAVDQELVATKFNVKSKDGMFAWSSQRAAVIARANYVAAQTAMNSGTRVKTSTWAWLPSLGLYTFLPGSGSIYSPFGYSFYSPSYLTAMIYAPAMNTGYSGASQGWSGIDSSSARSAASGGSSAAAAASSGAVTRSAPAPSAAPAAVAAPAARGR